MMQKGSVAVVVGPTTRPQKASEGEVERRRRRKEHFFSYCLWRTFFCFPVSPSRALSRQQALSDRIPPSGETSTHLILVTEPERGNRASALPKRWRERQERGPTAASTDRQKKRLPSAFLPRSLARQKLQMERIRGFNALFVVGSLLLATAHSAASAAGAPNAAAGDADAPIEKQHQPRRLRAASSSRLLLDVMPWDTVTDQPGSIASTVRAKTEG